MKAVVIGGGVVGMTTAYYLDREGIEVTVLEAASELGTDATAGNAGLIAPGHSYSWASPAAPAMLLRSLAGQKTAIRVKPRLDPALVRWGTQFLRECTPARAKRNTLVKLRLCQYSHRQLIEVARAENIEYDQHDSGMLYCYDDPAALAAAAERMQLLVDHGEDQRVIDADEVLRLEPALERARGKLAGAIYGKGDSSGNSQTFAQELSKRLDARATVRCGTPVRRIVADGDRISGVVVDGEIVTGDIYVLTAGVASPALTRSLKLRLPIYPAKGYRVDFPIRDGDAPPSVPGVDEPTLVAWSRLGSKFRLTSTAEFAGYDRSWSQEDFYNIMKVAKSIFPDVVDYSKGQYRACLRPMTPDGPPIVGWAPKHRNLFLNTGHGHMGWTMSCGSARIAVDTIVGREPEVPLEGMGYRW